jgi:ribosomal protein S18 acetylase RimI-like enzyme
MRQLKAIQSVTLERGAILSQVLSIRELALHELYLAVDLTARGMRDNPLNVAAFGVDENHRLVRMRRMFHLVLAMIYRKGQILGAFEGPTLVGIAATVPSGQCQPSLREKLALTPRMLAGLGPVGFVRMLRWAQAWAARDGAVAHWHLGPVAVDAHLQGRGIGSQLMTEYCRRLDRVDSVGYLETDKPENVTFYLRFGFHTVGEERVLNTPNWFMQRDTAVSDGGAMKQ